MEPVFTVMEYMLHGDLKKYLLARRHLECAGAGAGEDAEEQVSARRLTCMALDVARALSYLEQLRYVHRDVTAHNCLVSSRRVIQLADFGITRLVFENDYYRFSRKGMLPMRWMAPESLAVGVFSPASDVWSFSVLLYEIVTSVSLPFQGLSNSEVLSRVKGSQTLELPIGLKPQLIAATGRFKKRDRHIQNNTGFNILKRLCECLIVEIKAQGYVISSNTSGNEHLFINVRLLARGDLAWRFYYKKLICDQ